MRGSTPTATDLWRMGAAELAEAIRSKKASSVEVVAAHLRRIEAVNPSLNALPVVLTEQALDAAKQADRKVAVGEELPPLHGVPFTVKSNIDVLGTPTTHGLRAFTEAYPTVGWPGRRADEGSRRDPDWPEQHARLRDQLAHAERALWSDGQPVGLL